ncbi:MAG: class I SAM-dependent methyltransferase [Parvularculaceae bacterium]
MARRDGNARIASLKAKLEEVRQANAARNARAGAQIEELKNKLQAVRADAAGKIKAVQEIDAVEHNTAATMDSFFKAIDDETPYLMFAEALSEKLASAGVSFDGKTVADMGTGPGLVLRQIIGSASPAAVSGYDFSATALEHAQSVMPRATFAVGNIYTRPESRFDIVLCTEVLEHLEKPRLALENVLAAVGPRGQAILTVPDGRLDQSGYHINFWSAESWRNFIMAEAGGFDAEFDQFQFNPKHPRAVSNIAILTRLND